VFEIIEKINLRFFVFRGVFGVKKQSLRGVFWLKMQGFWADFHPGKGAIRPCGGRFPEGSS
jgi:hypothetical protein